MGVLDTEIESWFAGLEAKAREAIEKQAKPALIKLTAVVTEVQRQALAAKQRLEMAALVAAEAARSTVQNFAVKPGHVVIDAEIEDERAADDEESGEDSGDE